jgi:hypothetical protein
MVSILLKDKFAGVEVDLNPTVPTRPAINYRVQRRSNELRLLRLDIPAIAVVFVAVSSLARKDPHGPGQARL